MMPRSLQVAVGFSTLVLAAGVLVYEVALLLVLKEDSPWLMALPALVPFGALIAALFFRTSEENAVSDLARRTKRALERSRGLLGLLAMVGCGAATALGWYVWLVSQEKDAHLTIKVVQRDDLPEQAVSGMPVVLAHQLKPGTLEQLTDGAGAAQFAVDATDVFAIRIRQSNQPDAPIFVLDSAAQGGAGKAGFKLVKLSDVPKEAWIRSRPATAEPVAAEARFAQIPAAFFRWKPTTPGNVINAEENIPDFPFALPGAETIVRRKAYTVGFSPSLKLPRWAAYRIVPGAPLPREPDFPFDPALPASYQANTADYRATGFDRGHLVRRTDLFGLGQAELLKVSYLSAVVPQLAYVNRRTWLEVEEHAGQKAREGRQVYVLRGLIYDPPSPGALVNVTLMGGNLIPVPTHFFQIVQAVSAEGSSLEAHIVPNSYLPFEGRDIAIFKTSVARIAELTGLEFDPAWLVP